MPSTVALRMPDGQRLISQGGQRVETMALSSFEVAPSAWTPEEGEKVRVAQAPCVTSEKRGTLRHGWGLGEPNVAQGISGVIRAMMSLLYSF